MPDALPIPDDLIALQHAYDSAHATVEAHVQRVTAERQERFPDPPGRDGQRVHDADQAVLRAMWPEEESAELDRLRAVRDQALKAMNAHPTMVQALEERCWPGTQIARQTAARGDN
jgi:hypothetical protein